MALYQVLSTHLIAEGGSVLGCASTPSQVSAFISLFLKPGLERRRAVE
jgi:hypothetical protein